MMLATYGDGEPTTTAMDFNNWLCSLSEDASELNSPLKASLMSPSQNSVPRLQCHLLFLSYMHMVFN